MMRALRLTAAALVLAALSTLGAAAAQAQTPSASQQRVIQFDNWQW